MRAGARETPGRARGSGVSGSRGCFLLPALVFFVGYQVYPIVRVVWISFTDYQSLIERAGATGSGFDNYIEALQRPADVDRACGGPALFTIMFLPGTIILPLLLAILVDRVNEPRLATFYRVVLLIPAVIPSTLVFVLWKWMYNYQVGPINHLLVDVFGLFTLLERAAMARRHVADTAVHRHHGGVVGAGLPHHLLPRRAGRDPQGPAGGRAHRRRQRMAGLLACDAAAACADHDDPGRAALRLPAMAVIDEYLIFGGFNRDSPTYTWTIFMYDQAFKLRPWRQGFAAAIGMIGAVAMMVVDGLPAPYLPAAEADRAWRVAGDLPIERSVPIPRSRCRDASWFQQNRGAIVRHAVINFFVVIILLPLAWVLMMSIKSLPDAMRGDFWPRKFRLHPLRLRLREDRHAADQPVQQHLRHRRHGASITTVCAVLAGYALVHLRPRGGGIIVAALLVSLYFPVRVVSIISVYETQHCLGLINSTSGLILPYITLQPGDQRADHAQRVPARAARDDRGGQDRRLPGPGGRCGLIGLPMVRNGLVVIFIVNFVDGMGRVPVVLDAHRRPGARTMPVVLAAAQGGLGTVGMAEPRRRLRHRRHARHHRVHLRRRRLFFRASPGVLKG